MSKTLFNFLAIAGLVHLLVACASTPPPVDPPQAPAPKPVPELILNLPEPDTANCDCEAPPGVDLTFLEKGFNALNEGDFEEAVNYFRRYQRLESSPGVDWEAGIAVAYVKMLPQGPYYNWRAARDSYVRLMRQQPEGIQLHGQIVLMRDALAVLVDLHTQIDDLQRETATLSESLEKREEALRRLRELTLGQ